MRRTLFLLLVLAASVAVLGACGGGTVNTVPNKPESKPVTTPAPVVSGSPVTSPVVSPTTDPKASPAKTSSSPEVKKSDQVSSDDKGKESKPETKVTPKK